MLAAERAIVLASQLEFAFLVDALDRHEKELRRDGLTLPPGLVDLRDVALRFYTAGVQSQPSPPAKQPRTTAATRPKDGIRSVGAVTAAEMLDCTPQNVTKQARRGRLRGHKIRGAWVFDLAAVVDYQEKKVG